MSDFQTWQQKAATRKVKRAVSRERGIAALRAAGVAFEVLDGGWHLRIAHQGEVIDFTPGSDSWSIKGECGDGFGLHRGARALIRHLATGELPGVSA